MPGSYTWCSDWFLHLVQCLVPTLGAVPGSYTWCSDWFLHLVQCLVPTLGAVTGSYTWCSACVCVLQAATGTGLLRWAPSTTGVVI